MGQESTSCICGMFWTLACCLSLWHLSLHASWRSSKRPKHSSMWTCTSLTRTSAMHRCLRKSLTSHMVSKTYTKKCWLHDSLLQGFWISMHILLCILIFFILMFMHFCVSPFSLFSYLHFTVSI